MDLSIIQTIFALIILSSILSGVYYSIVLSQDFDNKPAQDKPLIVLIIIATILGGLSFFYSYVWPTLTETSSVKPSSVYIRPSIPSSTTPSAPQVPSVLPPRPLF